MGGDADRVGFVVDESVTRAFALRRSASPRRAIFRAPEPDGWELGQAATNLNRFDAKGVWIFVVERATLQDLKRFNTRAKMRVSKLHAVCRRPLRHVPRQVVHTIS